MVTIVTRNASGRIRGFLASCACEVASGVYVAPRMNAAVRDRVWDVVSSWCNPAKDMAVVMVVRATDSIAGIQVRIVGEPPVDLVEVDGHVLTRRDASSRTEAVVDDVPF